MVCTGAASAEAGAFVSALRNGTRHVFKSDVCHGEMIWILREMIVSPCREHDAEIIRKNASVAEIVVYNGEFLCEHEKLCVRAALCNADHRLEILFIGNISGGMEAKVSKIGCDGNDCVLVFLRGIQPCKVVLSHALLDVGEAEIPFSRVAGFRAGRVRRAGITGWKINGWNGRTKFGVGDGDVNGHTNTPLQKKAASADGFL